MKLYKIKILIGIVVLSFASCTKILDEQPRAILTPDIFQTPEGLMFGLTSAYNGLRYISGTEGAHACTEYGTDEVTAAASGGSKQLDMTPDNGGTGISSQTGSINTMWNYPFISINTCNGIIEFGPDAGIPEDVLAEAHFLRAYYYFWLVQQFGGVPLDLGAGELKFNNNPTTLSTRSTEEQVYQVIISDLTTAVENLPVEPRDGLDGAAFKATAIHYLAKVYLTHGDYQLALDEAEKLLNPGSPTSPNEYGVALLNSYAEVVAPGNEHSSEILFTCEHTNASYSFNETAAGYGSGPQFKDDRSLSYYTPNYQQFVLRDNAKESGFLSRTIEYSRPWIRYRPTYWLYTQAFADITNDSRFEATYQTTWLNNGSKSVAGLLTTPGDTVWLNPGDTAFVMLNHEVSDAYRNSKNYRIWTPSQMNRSIFPSCRKFFDPNRLDPNDASGRPFMLAKLSETYLLAAEAALRLNNPVKAREYILIVRQRAAKPGHEQDMIDATPATVDMDYLLDERSREFACEQMRWYDLKRTGKWRERSSQYSINGIDMINRDIENHYDLRPIPQNQIDLMGNSATEKSEYQNPGY